MADAFGFQDGYTSPATADKCTVSFGDTIGAAVQVQITYQQQINRRRTIGGAKGLIWASAPQGQASIQQMVVNSLSTGGAGWNACSPTTISFKAGGCGSSGGTIRGNGAVVSQFSISAEVEGMTVMNNLVIDFFSLSV